MKQNITSKGEVELNQAEVIQALLVQAQEDKKYLMTAVSNYLKKNHGYTLKTLASSNVHDEIVVRAGVEIVRTDMEPLFKPANGEQKDKRGPNSVAFVRKNKGMYAELLEYLNRATNKGKTPVDFEDAFGDMQVVFPEMDKRKFMMYVSDKRQQKAHGFVLKVLGSNLGPKAAKKTLNLN